MNRIRKALLFSGLDKETYKNLSPSIHQRNTKNLCIYSLVLTFHFIIITLISFFMRKGQITNPDKLCFFTAFLTALLFIATYFAYKRKTTSSITHIILNYLFMAVVYGEAIALTCFFPDFVGADKTFYIELVVLPMILMDRSIRMIIFQCLVCFIFIFTGYIFKTSELADYELHNFAFFLLISILIIIFVSSIRIRELMHGMKIQFISDHDLLTGVKNRNCFESDRTKIEDIKNKKLYFIYADVNELHEVNNFEGHKAGDIMLQAVADGLKKIFNEELIYRMGGDEFLAYSDVLSKSDIEKAIENLTKELAEKKYFVSFGIAGTDEQFSGLPELLTVAEARMYVEKKKYYQNKGLEYRNKTRDNNI